jgi:TolB-like protein
MLPIRSNKASGGSTESRPRAVAIAFTHTLPEWLHERRADLVTEDQIARWQRVVDMLVVAGDSRVADLADEELDQRLERSASLPDTPTSVRTRCEHQRARSEGR